MAGGRRKTGGPKALFERPEAIQAVMEAAAEEIVAMTDNWGWVQIPVDDQTAQAATATTLLPALPTVSLTQGIVQADYRSMAVEAVNLALGGEGLFANFVEQMVEAVTGGFENRLATVDYDGLTNGGGPGGGGGTPGGGGPNATPDGTYMGAGPNDPAPGAGPAPAAPPSGGGAPAKGKSPKNNAQSQQNFLGIFDAFCRNVNADPSGRSITGRERGIEPLLNQWIYHSWVTGLQCVLYRWGTVRVPELNYRPFQVPVEMEFLDPLRVNLDDLRTKGVIYYELPPKDRTELTNEVQQIGDAQKHPFFSMYPKKGFGNTPQQTRPVKPGVPQNVYSADEAYQLMQSQNKLPLPPDAVKLYRRSLNSAEIYPMPFATRVFSSVNDKRMLRSMDRSLIRKVIMMILHVSIASSDPKRPVREPDLALTKQRIENQLAADPEWLQILTTPDGAKIEWIIPEQGAILDHDKYRTVDFEILSSLVGLVANQLLSNSGNVDMSLIGKTLYQKNQAALMGFRRFLEEIYDEIIVKNNLRTIKPRDVNIVFKQISMFESDAFKTFIYNLVVKGMLPARVAIDHLGEDYDSAIEQLVTEEQLRQKYNILLVPPTNMQGVYPGFGGATPGAPGGGAPGGTKPAGDPGLKPSGPGGRPPGATDTQPRTNGDG